MLVSLAEFAQRSGLGYARAWRALRRGAVPGVREISGKLFVEIADGGTVTAGASVPPELRTLRQATTVLTGRPLELIATAPRCL